MKLLTSEQGQQLKPGDVVNVYWFTPRKPKVETDSIQWDGRQVWVDFVDRNEVVAESFYSNTHEVEGPLVKLVGRSGGFSVKKMELVH